MLIVNRSIVDRFLQRFTEELGKLKVGMPWETGVNIAPLPGPHRTAYMTEAFDDARAKGARLINEGGGSCNTTLFYPAVVYPVTPDMQLYREEQFGPLVPIGALVAPLVNQVCRVNLNCQCQRGPDVFPFAGRKDSAEETLSVADALRAFSIRSMVATKTSDSDKALLNGIVRDHQSTFINTGFIL